MKKFVIYVCCVVLVTFFVSRNAISMADNASGTNLVVGEVVMIPLPGSEFFDYKVKEGDTPDSIATNFGVTVDEIVRIPVIKTSVTETVLVNVPAAESCVEEVAIIEPESVEDVVATPVKSVGTIAVITGSSQIVRSPPEEEVVIEVATTKSTTTPVKDSGTIAIVTGSTKDARATTVVATSAPHEKGYDYDQYTDVPRDIRVGTSGYVSGPGSATESVNDKTIVVGGFSGRTPMTTEVVNVYSLLDMRVNIIPAGSRGVRVYRRQYYPPSIRGDGGNYRQPRRKSHEDQYGGRHYYY